VLPLQALLAMLLHSPLRIVIVRMVPRRCRSICRWRRRIAWALLCRQLSHIHKDIFLNLSPLPPVRQWALQDQRAGALIV
jgi:hypothetical protein